MNDSRWSEALDRHNSKAIVRLSTWKIVNEYSASAAAASGAVAAYTGELPAYKRIAVLVHVLCRVTQRFVSHSEGSNSKMGDLSFHACSCACTYSVYSLQSQNVFNIKHVHLTI